MYDHKDNTQVNTLEENFCIVLIILYDHNDNALRLERSLYSLDYCCTTTLLKHIDWRESYIVLIIAVRPQRQSTQTEENLYIVLIFLYGHNDKA